MAADGSPDFDAAATPPSLTHLPPPEQQALGRALPKVLLHDHLDGGLRPATLLEGLRRRGLAAPVDEPALLADWFAARAHAGSLQAYLRGFGLTVAAMADAAMAARVAFEAAEDVRQDGVVLAEFRMAPLLLRRHGLAPDAAVEAMLDGLSRSSLPSGLIVCAMRDDDESVVAEAAELALRWYLRPPHEGRARVVGFDLAGPEAGWPPGRLGRILERLRGEGLALTLHAGEADAGERVLEAARLGAARIGHGVRLVDLIGTPAWPEIRDELAARRTHLEQCPGSNVHTGAAASLAAHPIGRLWREGIGLSFHTDNRLVSATRASLEAARLVQTQPLDWADLQAMGLLAAQASFLAPELREQAARRIADWAPPARRAEPLSSTFPRND